MLTISESWLDQSHTDNSVAIEGYNVIRRDRDTHAGGVCMYVREDLSFNQRPDLQSQHLEDLWIELLLPRNKPIIVGTCYRAPKNNQVIECLEYTLNMLDNNNEVFILGDFNICMLKNSRLKDKYSRLLNSNNYKQLITTPTRESKSSSSLIDHICTNSSEKVSQSGVIESGISDHFIIFCTRKRIREYIGKHKSINIRSLKNYNEEIYRENLRHTDWTPVYSSYDSNDTVEKFNTILTQIIDDNAPLKNIHIKNGTQPWINNEILEAMHERDKVLYHSNRNKANEEI